MNQMRNAVSRTGSNRMFSIRGLCFSDSSGKEKEIVLNTVEDIFIFFIIRKIGDPGLFIRYSSLKPPMSRPNYANGE